MYYGMPVLLLGAFPIPDVQFSCKENGVEIMITLTCLDSLIKGLGLLDISLTNNYTPMKFFS